MRLLNGDNDLLRLSLRERPFFLDFSESENYKRKNVPDISLFYHKHLPDVPRERIKKILKKYSPTNI